jgi:hypothetical protein
MYQSKAEIAKRKNSKAVPSIVAISLLLLTGVASATGGLDVTAATGELSGEVTTNIELVGVGIFTLSAIAMGISWIKATFFG